MAADAEKDKPFDAVFSALGVQFDLRECPNGTFAIGNTEARKEELCDRLSDILAANALTPQESMSLRSRLLFAESQIYGRMAKLALAAVGGPSLSRRTMAPLGDELIFHLRWL